MRHLQDVVISVQAIAVGDGTSIAFLIPGMYFELRSADVVSAALRTALTTGEDFHGCHPSVRYHAPAGGRRNRCWSRRRDYGAGPLANRPWATQAVQDRHLAAALPQCPIRREDSPPRHPQ